MPEVQPGAQQPSEQVLAHYRLQRARELLTVSSKLLDSGHYGDSINRSYFAIFSALRAVLALNRFDSKKLRV